jgi:hypothetical protein
MCKISLSRFVLSGLVLTVYACGTDQPEPSDASAEVAGETTEETAGETPPASPTTTRYLVALDTMGFGVEIEPGVAPGFDLDNRISKADDETSCGHEDYISPEGTPGIDNQLASIAPLFDLFGIGAAETLIQNAIDEGGLLLLLQIDGVDDLQNDSEVIVTLRAGHGIPLLGTDGLLLSGQTFHLHPDTPDDRAEIASIEEGVLEAGPFAATLPIVVFGIQYELVVEDARLRAVWTEEKGLVSGVFGGQVSLETLYTIGETAAMDDGSVLPAIRAVFQGAGDMAQDEDGACQAVSAALVFTGVSAFFFPDEDVSIQP